MQDIVSPRSPWRITAGQRCLGLKVQAFPAWED